MSEAPVNVAGQDAPAGNNADHVDASPSKALKKTSSVKKAFKKVFTPRRSSGSDEIPNVAEAEQSDSSDSKKKKKGIASAIRNLGSKGKTPRGTAAVTEKASDVAAEVKDSAEKISDAANAIAEETAAAAKDEAKAAIEASDDIGKDLSKVTEEVKEDVAATTEKVQAAVPDVSTVAAPPVAEEATAGMSDEVQTAQAAATEKVQVATRAVELPAKPVVDEKVKEAEEAKKLVQVEEEKKGKGSANKGGSKKRGRGPLVSVIGIAAGVAFVAFKMLAKSK